MVKPPHYHHQIPRRDSRPRLSSRAKLGKRLARYNANMRMGSFRFLISLVVISVLFPFTVRAQEPVPPPQTPAPVPEAPSKTQPHAFWDRTNILLFSGVAVFRGLDYASTRNFMARGRGEILIPDDVVNNTAGFVALEAAATATSIGISYVFHRTGHHKLERWLSIGHIVVTGVGVVNNYSLKSHHH
jgi:hypothetical protein